MGTALDFDDIHAGRVPERHFPQGQTHILRVGRNDDQLGPDIVFFQFGLYRMGYRRTFRGPLIGGIQVLQETLLDMDEAVQDLSQRIIGQDEDQQDKDNFGHGQLEMSRNGQQDAHKGDSQPEQIQREQRPGIAFPVLDQLGLGNMHAGARTGESVNKRSLCQHGQHHRQDVPGILAPGSEPFGQDLVREQAAQHGNGNQQHQIDTDADEIILQVHPPFTQFHARMTFVLLHAVDPHLPVGGHFSAQQTQRRAGRLDHIRRRKGRNHRHGNHHGVDKVTHHAQRTAERCDDKAELTQLCERKTGIRSGLEALSGQDGTAERKEQVADDNHQGQHQYGSPVCADNSRIHHHAHGNEENGTEQVFDAAQQMFDTLPFQGFGQDGTHDEGTQCGGKPYGVGNGYHTETQAHGHHQQGLVIEKFLGLFECRRNNIDANQEPQNQEKDQAYQRFDHGPAFKTARCGHGGKQHHQQDGNQVLHHQAAEDDRGIGFLFQPHFVIGLDNDGGRGHGQQSAKEDAFHGGPAHKLGHDDAQDEHAHTLDHRHGDGSAAHFDQFLETEFKPQGEQKENDTDLRPLVHRFVTGQGE